MGRATRAGAFRVHPRRRRAAQCSRDQLGIETSRRFSSEGRSPVYYLLLECVAPSRVEEVADRVGGAVAGAGAWLRGRRRCGRRITRMRTCSRGGRASPSRPAPPAPWRPRGGRVEAGGEDRRARSAVGRGARRERRRPSRRRCGRRAPSAAATSRVRATGRRTPGLGERTTAASPVPIEVSVSRSQQRRARIPSPSRAGPRASFGAPQRVLDPRAELAEHLVRMVGRFAVTKETRRP